MCFRVKLWSIVMQIHVINVFFELIVVNREDLTVVQVILNVKDILIKSGWLSWVHKIVLLYSCLVLYKFRWRWHFYHFVLGILAFQRRAIRLRNVEIGVVLIQIMDHIISHTFILRRLFCDTFLTLFGIVRNTIGCGAFLIWRLKNFNSIRFWGRSFKLDHWVNFNQFWSRVGAIWSNSLSTVVITFKILMPLRLHKERATF